MSITLPTTNDRNNNFNFLRLLFASLVLVSHAPQMRDGNPDRDPLFWLTGTSGLGNVAVSGFFLLSGYLIVNSWQSQPALRPFFEKRIRRIYPGFIVAFLFSVFVVAPFAVESVSRFFSQMNWWALASSLVQLKPPAVPPVFPGTHYADLNGSLYTISYEFRCYILVALVGMLGTKPQRWIWLGLLVVSVVVAHYSWRIEHVTFPGQEVLFGNLGYLANFLVFYSAGACFAFFRRQIPLNGKIAVVAALGLVASIPFATTAREGLIVCGGYLLFWVAFAQFSSLDWFKRMPDVSFGVYLYGWPVQKLLDYYFPTVSVWLLIPVALVVCCAAGYLSWHLVESPFLPRKHKVKSPVPALAAN